MYSPTIHPALITILYRIGQHRKQPMTRVTDQCLLEAPDHHLDADAEEAVCSGFNTWRFRDELNQRIRIPKPDEATDEIQLDLLKLTQTSRDQTKDLARGLISKLRNQAKAVLDLQGRFF